MLRVGNAYILTSIFIREGKKETQGRCETTDDYRESQISINKMLKKNPKCEYNFLFHK